MADVSIQQSGSCRCGAARFTMVGKPLLRAYCHCLICQEFNEADYGDVTVFYAKDVALADESTVDFRVYQQPPLVKRGKCTRCGKPAIEKLSIPLLPRMALVPSNNISDSEFLPTPAFHMFYHRRKADVADNLPKYNGFLNSQSRFSLAIVMSMLFGGGRAGKLP